MKIKNGENGSVDIVEVSVIGRLRPQITHILIPIVPIFMH